MVLITVPPVSRMDMRLTIGLSFVRWDLPECPPHRWQRPCVSKVLGARVRGVPSPRLEEKLSLVTFAMTIGRNLLGMVLNPSEHSEIVADVA